MNNLDLHKDFYFREIDRKNQLTDYTNLPILIISVIISIQTYFYELKILSTYEIYPKILTILTFISLSYSIFYIFKSFTNFYKNFEYMEIIISETFEKTFNETTLKNNNAETVHIIYNNRIVELLLESTKNNFYINKQRTEDLAKSKKGLFLSFLFTYILVIYYFYTLMN